MRDAIQAIGDQQLFEKIEPSRSTNVTVDAVLDVGIVSPYNGVDAEGEIFEA